MLPGIPRARATRILEDTAVYGIAEQIIDVAEAESFAGAARKVQLVFQPSIHTSAAPPVVADFLEYLPHCARAYGVHDDLARMIIALVIEVSADGHPGE